MISFGAGVAPADCAAPCNDTGLVGRWLVGVSVAMVVSLAFDQWTPLSARQAVRDTALRWRERWRTGYRPARRALPR